MSLPIPKGDNNEAVITADTDVQRKVLSKRSLEFIGTRVSQSSEAPQLNAEGFRRIPNPLNWQFVSEKEVEPQSEPDVKPVYLEIPDKLHSVQTLRFLGFQLAIAKKIFASFISYEHENANHSPGFAELAKAHVEAAESMANTFALTEGQPMGDINHVVILTQVFMGLNLDGDRLDGIDPPERPIFWSTIKDWVIEVLDCRYAFLCNLDPAILGMMEMTDRQPQPEQDEAARKARNRKKAEAKKAVKQRRRKAVLKAVGEDEGRVKGNDDQGRLLEFADDTEEIRGAQASKMPREPKNSP